MSYRDLRNFTEIMRSLGYKRLISMENFKNPAFPLVAEILTWLALRFDSTADVPSEIDSAQDRIIFMKYIIEFMVTKANVKLNPKRLYGADGLAVKELLKASSILYDASRQKNSRGDGEEEEEEEDGGRRNESLMTLRMELAGRSQELMEARKMATELTRRGASLYDLLGKEVDLRMIRLSALSNQLEVTNVEKLLERSNKATEDELRNLMSKIENVASDEANLDVKIEKKRAELERNRKRFDTLQSVRPAYMDELEKLEEELLLLYEQYTVKHRNLVFLESIFDKYGKCEKDLREVIERQMKKTLAEASDPKKEPLVEDMDDDDDEDMEDDDSDDDDDDDDEDDDDEFKSSKFKFNQRNRGGQKAKVTDQRNGFDKRPTTGRRAPATRSVNALDDDEDDDDEEDLNLSGDSVEIENGDVGPRRPGPSGDRGAGPARGKAPHPRTNGRPMAATRSSLGNRSSKARSKPQDSGDDDEFDDDDF